MNRIENNHQNDGPRHHTQKWLQHEPAQVERDGSGHQKCYPACLFNVLLHGRASLYQKQGVATECHPYRNTSSVEVFVGAASVAAAALQFPISIRPRSTRNSPETVSFRDR